MGKLLELLTLEWFHVIAAVVLTVALTALYERWFPPREDTGPNRNAGLETKKFLIMKFSGFAMFGLLPFFLYLFFLGEEVTDWLGSWPGVTDWLITGACILPAIASGALGSRKENVRRHYPQMRLDNWNPEHVLVSLAGWLIYLAGYEFLFRGMLLQLSIPVMGTAVAIIVNVALYSLAHLGKSPREALGALPFGVLLCLLAIWTGSLLAPLLVHFSLSVSAELFSVGRNPEMRFVKNGR